MSTVLAVSMPQPRWSVGTQWIAAHVSAQLICLGTAAAAYGIATLVGANDPAAGAALKNVAYGLAILTELIYAFAAASLRGAVLRQVLPVFPMRLWVAVVVGYIMLLGLMSGFTTSSVAPAARVAPQLTTSYVLFGVMLSLISGTVVGVAIGAIEALVIRRAADGAAYWAVWMAVAFSASMAVVLAIGTAMLMVPDLSATTIMAIGVVAKLLVGLLMGALTLPALLHITPRTPGSSPPAA